MKSSMQAIAAQFDSAAQQDQAATFGVWVFLATELLFFGPMFFGYLYGRMHFPAAFAAASRHTDIVLGTLNTAILLTSSLAMVIAVAAREATENNGANEASAREPAARQTAIEEAAQHESAATRLAMWTLAVTAMLGIAFMVVKGTEYAHEWQEHLFPGPGFAIAGADAQGAQYFFFLYFAMTALHALHLTIGIVAVTVLAIALHRKKQRFASARHIRLVGLYWHFVDIVWIFLYPILYLVGRSSA